VGFTNVVWASRSTEQLARDLTDGPGPGSVGGTGAAWVRVANEFAGISSDFDKLVTRLRTVWDSQASSAAVQRLEEFGKWLQAVSLNAAANGQRAEEAAVANTVAVLAMPSVSEAIEAKAAQDMMASLAAYNGAVLTGNFAEFDEAATADQANAAAVISSQQGALQLRFLQTMVEIGSEKNTTILLPFPIELIRPLIDMSPEDGATPARPLPQQGSKSG